jgi:integrase/recombinase XerD
MKINNLQNEKLQAALKIAQLRAPRLTSPVKQAPTKMAAGRQNRPAVPGPESRPTPKRRYGEHVYLTSAELEALERAIAEHAYRTDWQRSRDRAIFCVAARRGLRASEVGLLTFADLRIQDRRLMVRRLKGSAGGEFPLADSELAVLKKWIRERGVKEGPLFPARGGKPISRFQLHKLVNEYGAAAKLSPDKRHFHVLRHTAGQKGAEADLDVADVQDLLGHRNPANTMKYFAVSNERRKRTAKKVKENW